MNKTVKMFVITWLLLAGVFNLIAFVTPAEIGGISKYEGAFWPSYGIVMAAYVIYLIFVLKKLQGESTAKSALISISSIALGILTIVGLACMLIPKVPYWVGTIGCAITLALSIIFVMTTEIVEDNKNNANSRLRDRYTKGDR